MCQVAPKFEPITSEYLDYNEVMEKYEQMMRWLAKVYVNALKIIHYMHDKYDYEAYEMALHDGDVQRIRATGIAGLSIVADSLAAIRDCKVKVIRDERGLAVDFEREGEYVPYGNNDDPHGCHRSGNHGEIHELPPSSTRLTAMRLPRSPS